jgi:hypothetical protein
LAVQVRFAPRKVYALTIQEESAAVHFAVSQVQVRSYLLHAQRTHRVEEAKEHIQAEEFPLLATQGALPVLDLLAPVSVVLAAVAAVVALVVSAAYLDSMWYRPNVLSHKRHSPFFCDHSMIHHPCK